MWIQVIFLCITPVLLYWLGTRWAWLDRIGVVTACYILGILLANMPVLSLIDTQVSKQVVEIVVPLFLPLLLFNSQLKVWKTLGKGIFLSFFLCVLSVSFSALLATFLFKGLIKNAWLLGSMMVGVYTGGTPNLSAIGLSLNAPAELIIVMSAADLLYGGLWIIFLFGFAKPFFSYVLPSKALSTEQGETIISLEDRFIYPGSLIALLLSIFILGLSVGISWLIYQRLDEILIILTISSLGILGSFLKPIQRLKGSYGMGNYLLLVFCLSVGSMADFNKIWDTGFWIILFVGFMMFSSISLHLLFSYIFRIDVDTFLITSTAGLYGPAFIAPVAKAIGNPLIIPIGIASALLGYGIANYIGISLSYLLRLL